MGVDTNKYEFELDVPKDLSSSIESERRLTGNSNAHDAPADSRASWIGEASEMYGDYHTAEDFGYVTRGYVALISWTN